MFLAVSALLATALTIIGVAIGLAVLFFFMYHTFHGDLPVIMKTVVAIILIIGFILLSIAIL